MSISNLLKRVQLFANLEPGELEQLAAICQEKTVGSGETIITQNTTGKEMYIVAQGSAEVYIQGLSDARSLVVLGKGQVIGEMALIDQGYRSASVRATREGASLYVIESEAFYKLCDANNHIGFIVMRNLAIDIAFKLRHRNLTEL
ncbi:MAG: cyclic nucleotide-binding domain-containing protein [Anaerolineae bacterium]|jgi:CRP/FNR family cyclic AMP-dependent transcriptional regulator|nr:cyclic nucleotide-binding domain-containing protein [Anaerolineae bacterium]